MDPQPIPYATPARRATPQAAVALTAVTPGWRSAAGAAWLAGTVAAVVWVAGRLADDQQTLATMGAIAAVGGTSGWAYAAHGLAGPVLFAVCVGAAVSALLYDRSVNRLAWVAVGPALVGAWSLVGVDRMAAVVPVAGTVAVQAALVFAGTRIGRPVARWLARHVVPPPFRAALVALWI